MITFLKNKRFLKLIFVLFLIVCMFSMAKRTPPWGFFGHRRINRLAIFTLPPPLIGFYKKNIEFITEHAVDPDKRRYASKFEAIRHYIDLDHWGTFPFDNLPRKWVDALMKFTDVYVVQNQDTIQIMGADIVDYSNKKILETPLGKLSKRQYKSFIYNNIFPQYYQENWVIAQDSLQKLFGDKWKYPNAIIIAKDRISSEGIVPYYLPRIEKRLTRAMKNMDINQVLELSADIGHYIADAHVPLHTTQNYNGQMTHQYGIHAFWESRIPELFADETYDYFVGTADYIDNTTDFYWKVVLESHRHVQDVLGFEKELSKTYPQDQQYCQVERNNAMVRLQCENYTKAYQEKMDGLVENRMRAAIKSVGDIWFTCWVNAGKPDLSKVDAHWSDKDIEKQKELDKQYRQGKIFGRGHED